MRVRVLPVNLLLSLLVVGCTFAVPGTEESVEPGAPEAAPTPPAEEAARPDTLTTVRSRGHLRCGTDEAGFWSPRGLGGGFASDVCAVIAAAVLGDAGAVERIPVSDGVATLAAGDADVVVGGLAWTVSRDGVGGIAFTTPLFYDGVGVMVRAGGVHELAGLTDAVVCVPESRLTVGAARRLEQLGARPVTFADAARVEAAFRARACDAWADDLTRLIEARDDYVGDPDDLVILPQQLTLHPLAPAVADGDHVWRDAVTWALLATVVAEDAGLDREGVDERDGTDDPTVRRLLGLRTEVPGDDRPSRFQPGLGLPADFAARVVGQVGNLAEIHARHFGALGTPRGATALSRDGGLLQPPPYH